MKLSSCFAADFETTTDENDCRVWAYALCNVEDYTDFKYGNSLKEFFDFCSNPVTNYKIWFHNLKFDGVYIIDYLLKNGFEWVADRKDKADKTFTTLITDMGQFYSIVIYFKVKAHHTNKVEIYDSLKIFPNFSVERIAKGFNLPISKLSIDYDEYREPGHQLTEQEIAYIRNDVEIVARALKEMFSRGLTKMTIASDAMQNFKDGFKGFRKKLPLLDPEVDADIRKSYRGGFTYVNDTWKENKVGKGVVLDVNSLYPSCMSSPYKLPYSQPKRFNGKYEYDEIYPLYVQSITCSFEIKPGKIPSIQIRNHLSFVANEYVKSTNGKEITLFLTTPDFELFQEQYNIHNPIYNGGWKFKAATGLFDNYINYWTDDHGILYEKRRGTKFFDECQIEADTLVCEEDREMFKKAMVRETLLEQINMKRSFEMTYRVPKEGEPFFVRMRATRALNDDNVLIIGIHDVDEEMKLARAEELLREADLSRRLFAAQQQANIDPMTGVRNKRSYLEAEARLEYAIKETEDSKFAISIVDVNDLKYVNDKFGHQAGDQHIRNACRIVCTTFKRSPVFRVGGDEFCVISQGDDYENINELLKKIEDHNREALLNGGVVIACGTAMYKKGDSVTDVYKRADEAMYENKARLKKGREVR